MKDRTEHPDSANDQHKQPDHSHDRQAAALDVERGQQPKPEDEQQGGCEDEEAHLL
jgi:hypothetical protein